MEDVFTKIYERKIWGDNENPNYDGSSGEGCSISYNKNNYVPFLKDFIYNNKIKTVVDLGCGDFRCGKVIYDSLDVSYTGYDVYKKLIDYNSREYPLPKYSFKHLDIYNNKESIIDGELCILKDVISHWTINHIYTFLDYLVESKKFKYILICNCGKQTEDNSDIEDAYIENGYWRALSCSFLPLKKYNITKLFNYNYKEVSLIKIN
jgi:hypothetical protein